MAFLHINSRFLDVLSQQGLVTAEDFLRLSGVIYCGHPDRHVARVTLGTGPQALGAFLKKEHRVPWRDRLANAGAGFGLVSKSCREMALGPILHEAGIPCPEVIAAGEKGRQAFLLVRALDDATDLRCFLQHCSDSGKRRQLARQLGTALARIHNAGLDHPDLYAKHILVEPETNQLWILDWQRSRRRARLSGSIRCRDLAALDATLAEDVASPRERLTCLQAYRRACVWLISPGGFSRMARRIRRRSDYLLRKRYIREQRQPPLPPGQQNLIWLEGEALCVTREFHREVQTSEPAWFTLLRQPVGREFLLQRKTVTLPENRQAQLVRRRESRLGRWLWSWLRRRMPPSKELEQAASWFRLQRCGIALPRLLAVGQRHQRPWETESFLLTESEPATAGLHEWLAAPRNLPQRRHVLRQAGDVLRRLHEACYFFDDTPQPERLWQLKFAADDRPRIMLASVEGLRRHGQCRPERILRDLRGLQAGFAPVCSRTDALSFFFAYIDLPRLNAEARKWLAKLSRRHRVRMLTP